MTVTELLDTLQSIEADGHGDARLFAYLGADGLKVQAEDARQARVVLRAPIKISAGAAVVR